MKKAVREFNAKPKRGISFLVESELCDEGSAEQIATWLFKEENLKKGAIVRPHIVTTHPLSLSPVMPLSHAHSRQRKVSLFHSHGVPLSHTHTHTQLGRGRSHIRARSFSLSLSLIHSLLLSTNTATTLLSIQTTILYAATV